MDSIYEALSDADLIAEIRNGNDQASGELFSRHHDAALAFAVKLGGATLAPDLVSDAFVKLFAVLRHGGGPDVSFRPYLLTTVRRTHIDHLRRTRREVPADLVEEFAGGEAGLVHVDDPDARFEKNAILRAFRCLPERWQTALWLAVVENEPLERVAVMRVRLTDIAELHVHTDRDYGHWRCSEEASAGKDRSLVCHLSPEAGRSDDFGLDVRLDPDSTASVAARVRPAEGEDREPANNVAHLTVSVSGEPATTPRPVAEPAGPPMSSPPASP